MRLAHTRENARKSEKTTPVGFEPTRGDPIGLAGRRLNHSAKVSLPFIGTSHIFHFGVDKPQARIGDDGAGANCGGLELPVVLLDAR